MAGRKATPPAEPAGPRDVPSDYFDDAWVEIYPEHGLVGDTARALLDAAGRLGYDAPRAVVAVSGGFRTLIDVLAVTELPSVPSSDGHRVTATPLAALGKGAVPDGDSTDAAS